MPTPYGMLPRSETEWASLSMANLTPASRAARMWSDGRSSRCGEALISSAVPVRAQARNSSAKSTSTGGRLPIRRVSGCPMTLTCGFSQAVMNRLVISARGLLEVRVHRGHADVEAGQEVRAPVHRAVRADVQLGAVQQFQAPVRWAASARTWSRWASIFSSVIRCMIRSGAWSVIA